MPHKDLPHDATPREKLLASGAGALSDSKRLALLLRTGIEGKGMLQPADQLLQLPGKGALDAAGFCGIAGLLIANAEDLQLVKGLGPAKRAEIVAVTVAATLAVPELARHATAQRLQKRTVLTSFGAVKHYLQLRPSTLAKKVFAFLFSYVQKRLMAMEELFRGTLTQITAFLRQEVKRVLHHASAVVQAHKRHGGSVQPSRAYELLNDTLKTALALVNVRVLNHLIVGQGKTLSMAEQGLL